MNQSGELLKLDDSIVGTWDRGRIEQVLVNLISNAIKYAPATRIVIESRLQDGMAAVSVIDQGPGIPKEKQSLIFERFERATSSRNISGLGLGLFIVKQIVEGHAGVIEVQSDAAHGTSFTVRLPLNPLRRESKNSEATLSAKPAET